MSQQTYDDEGAVIEPARVDRVVTAGTFSLDGGTWDVDNNVWVVGDDDECIVIDPAHEVEPILDVVMGRQVLAILCTHAHDDHISAVTALRDATGAPALVHPDDRMLWDVTVPSPPDAELADGMLFEVGGIELQVLHTPGHSPGSCSMYAEALGSVFSGDTLFQGGPGATGRSYSHFGTIIESIRTKLLTLPEDTVVLTGHGSLTTIGQEAPDLDSWIARGQ